ncbi:MAG: hypothetical protein ACI9LF_001172 [Flavobacteriales bacterium]|jgi:hypothetical protein
MGEEKEMVAFKLPNKVVYVKPIKGRSWLPIDHAASFLFGESSIEYVVPRDSRGVLVDPLTPEERDFFESRKQSGMDFEIGDLSVHRKKENYWHKFVVKLDSRQTKLDLSKPVDYMRYKVLLTNKKFICPSADKESVDRKLSYKFCIAEEGEEIRRKSSGLDSMKEAFLFFNKMSSSNDDMIDFLNQYKLRNTKFKKSIPKDAKDTFLKSEIGDIITNDISTFLDITNDPYYEDKKLVVNGLSAGAIELVGRSYQTPESVFLGDNTNEVVKYLNNKMNNEIKLQILGRIENN